MSGADGAGGQDVLNSALAALELMAANDSAQQQQPADLERPAPCRATIATPTSSLRRQSNLLGTHRTSQVMRRNTGPAFPSLKPKTSPSLIVEGAETMQQIASTKELLLVRRKECIELRAKNMAETLCTTIKVDTVAPMCMLGNLLVVPSRGNVLIIDVDQRHRKNSNAPVFTVLQTLSVVKAPRLLCKVELAPASDEEEASLVLLATHEWQASVAHLHVQAKGATGGFTKTKVSTVYSGHWPALVQCSAAMQHCAITGDSTGSLHQWDWSGSLLRRFLGHETPLCSLTVHCGRLYAGAVDGSLREFHYAAPLTTGGASAATRLWKLSGHAVQGYLVHGDTMYAWSTYAIFCVPLEEDSRSYTPLFGTSVAPIIKLLVVDDAIICVKTTGVEEFSKADDKMTSFVRFAEPLAGALLLDSRLLVNSERGAFFEYHPQSQQRSSSLVLSKQASSAVCIQAFARRFLVRASVTPEHCASAGERSLALQGLILENLAFLAQLHLLLRPYAKLIEKCMSSGAGNTLLSTIAEHSSIISKLSEALLRILDMFPVFGPYGSVLLSGFQALAKRGSSLLYQISAAINTIKMVMEGHPLLIAHSLYIRQNTSHGLIFLLQRPFEIHLLMVSSLKRLLKCTPSSSRNFGDMVHTCGIAFRLSIHVPSLLRDMEQTQRAAHFKEQFNWPDDVQHDPRRTVLLEDVAHWNEETRRVILCSDALLIASVVKGLSVFKKKPKIEACIPLRNTSYSLTPDGKSILFVGQEFSWTKAVENLFTPSSAKVRSEWAARLATQIELAKNSRAGLPLETILFNEETNVPLIVASAAEFCTSGFPQLSLLDALLTECCPSNQRDSSAHFYARQSLSGSAASALLCVSGFFRESGGPLVRTVVAKRMLEARRDPLELAALVGSMRGASQTVLAHLCLFLHELCFRHSSSFSSSSVDVGGGDVGGGAPSSSPWVDDGSAGGDVVYWELQTAAYLFAADVLGCSRPRAFEWILGDSFRHERAAFCALVTHARSIWAVPVHPEKILPHVSSSTATTTATTAAPSGGVVQRSALQPRAADRAIVRLRSSSRASPSSASQSRRRSSLNVVRDSGEFSDSSGVVFDMERSVDGVQHLSELYGSTELEFDMDILRCESDCELEFELASFSTSAMLEPEFEVSSVDQVSMELIDSAYDSINHYNLFESTSEATEGLQNYLPSVHAYVSYEGFKAPIELTPTMTASEVVELFLQQITEKKGFNLGTRSAHLEEAFGGTKLDADFLPYSAPLRTYNCVVVGGSFKMTSPRNVKSPRKGKSPRRHGSRATIFNSLRGSAKNFAVSVSPPSVPKAKAAIISLPRNSRAEIRKVPLAQDIFGPDASGNEKKGGSSSGSSSKFNSLRFKSLRKPLRSNSNSGILSHMRNQVMQHQQANFSPSSAGDLRRRPSWTASQRRGGESPVVWDRAKLIVLGKENVGKTHLIRALQNLKYDNNMSTDGVDIGEWILREDDQQAYFHTFDFGGQSLFYMTHQFFLTRRSVYLLVFKMTEDLERVSYWLSTVSHTVGGYPRPPVILVGTHLDALDEEAAAAVHEKVEAMSRSYSSYIKAICFVSCTKQTGLSQLRSQVFSTARDERLLFSIVPSYYATLYSAVCIHRSSTPVLSWLEFKTIASNSDVPIDANLLAVTTFLHNMGVIVYFESNPRLSDIVILDPAWLADRMSDLISLKHKWNNGIVDKPSLDIIWRNFDSATRLNVLHVLEQFQILYLTHFDGDDYKQAIVPCMLPLHPSTPRQQLEALSEVRGGPVHSRFYALQFAPLGFVSRLVTCFHYQGDTTQVLDAWRTGVRLQVEGSLALVECLGEGGGPVTIEIKAGGSPALACVIQVANALIRDFFGSQREACVTVRCPQCAQGCFAFDALVRVFSCGTQQVQCTACHQSMPISRLAPDVAFSYLPLLEGVAIGEHIGEGGFATIYKGEYRGRPVAVKELHVGTGHEDVEALEAFREFSGEVMMMSKISHVNLVKLEGIVLHPLRMVMEFCPLPDLSKFLYSAELRIEHSAALACVLDVARALAYLHQQHPPILHRDVRSANCFVVSLERGAECHCKLGDYGLAAALGGKLKESLASFQWAAPETLQGGADYDESSDVYSLCMVVYEVEARAPPFTEYHSFFTLFTRWTSFHCALCGEQRRCRQTPECAQHQARVEECGEKYVWKQMAIIAAITRSHLRPSIPAGTVPAVASLMTRGWSADAAARPLASDVCRTLQSVLHHATPQTPDLPAQQQQRQRQREDEEDDEDEDTIFEVSGSYSFSSEMTAPLQASAAGLLISPAMSKGVVPFQWPLCQMLTWDRLTVASDAAGVLKLVDLWSQSSGRRVLCTVQAHEGPVTAMTVFDSAHLVTAGQMDARLFVWTRKKNKLKKACEIPASDHHMVAVTSMVRMGHNRLVTGDPTGVLVVWNVALGDKTVAVELCVKATLGTSVFSLFPHVQLFQSTLFVGGDRRVLVFREIDISSETRSWTAADELPCVGAVHSMCVTGGSLWCGVDSKVYTFDMRSLRMRKVVDTMQGMSIKSLVSIIVNSQMLVLVVGHKSAVVDVFDQNAECKGLLQYAGSGTVVSATLGCSDLVMCGLTSGEIMSWFVS